MRVTIIFSICLVSASIGQIDVESNREPYPPLGVK